MEEKDIRQLLQNCQYEYNESDFLNRWSQQQKRQREYFVLPVKKNNHLLIVRILATSDPLSWDCFQNEARAYQELPKWLKEEETLLQVPEIYEKLQHRDGLSWFSYHQAPGEFFGKEVFQTQPTISQIETFLKTIHFLQNHPKLFSLFPKSKFDYGDLLHEPRGNDYFSQFNKVVKKIKLKTLFPLAFRFYHRGLKEMAKEKVVLNHGDFKPQNLIKNKKIFLIDWERVTKTNRFYDYAFLLASFYLDFSRFVQVYQLIVKKFLKEAPDFFKFMTLWQITERINLLQQSGEVEKIINFFHQEDKK